MGWSDFLSTLKGNDPTDDDEEAHVNDLEGDLFPDEYDRVVFDDLPPGDIYRVRKSNDKYILIIDLSEADDEHWERAKSELREQFETAGGISVGSASPIVTAYRSEETQDYIERICGFYEDKLSPRILRMIRESLVLRIATDAGEFSYEEVRRRKRQISKYGDEGFSIASLCSAGYLDEGQFFWNLYEKLVTQGTYSTEDYEDIFLRLVKIQPFVVFVKYGDSPNEVYDNVVRKSIMLSDFDIDISFIDIRGMGDKNWATIRQAVDTLEEHHESLAYEEFQDDEELVIRVDPDSLS